MALKNSVLNNTDYLLRVGYVAIVIRFFKVVAFVKKKTLRAEMVYCFAPTCNHSSKSSVLKDISFLGSYTTFIMADGARDW